MTALFHLLLVIVVIRLVVWMPTNYVMLKMLMTTSSMYFAQIFWFFAECYTWNYFLFTTLNTKKRILSSRISLNHLIDMLMFFDSRTLETKIQNAKKQLQKIGKLSPQLERCLNGVQSLDELDFIVCGNSFFTNIDLFVSIHNCFLLLVCSV